MKKAVYTFLAAVGLSCNLNPIFSASSPPPEIPKVLQKKPVTPETLLSPEYSRSLYGRTLTWIKGTDDVAASVWENSVDGTWIERINTNTGDRQRLFKSDMVALSPGGDRVAFVKDSQIWVASLDGTGGRQVSNAPSGINDWFYSWSPDGTKIAYTQTPPTPKNVTQASVDSKAKGSTVVVYNVGKKNAKQFDPFQLCIADITTGESRVVTSLKAETYFNPSWSADGKTIYLTCFFAYGDQEYDGRYISVVWVDTATGTTKPFVDHAIADSQLCLPSPVGDMVAFGSSPYHGGYFHNWQMTLADNRGERLHQITTPFKTEPFAWSSDGQSCYLLRRSGVHDEIVAVDRQGNYGKPLVQTDGLFLTDTIPAVSSDNRFAWFETDWQGRTLLRTASGGQQPRTIVNFTPEVDTYNLGSAEQVAWKARDGQKNAGVLIKPVGYVQGRKYPLIVDLHGGPMSGVHAEGTLCLGALEWQIWANKGYAVFIPEYRSSGVYGFDELLKEKKSHKLFDGDYDDIISGVDTLIARGIADPDKLAVMGMSYGSIETNWIITHTTRFRVAISYEGEADLLASYGATGTPWYPARWLMGGTPQQARKAYIYNSAIYSVGNTTTPTLFIAGSIGTNSPSLARMYVALKEQGIDTQYLVYMGEGHGVRQPANERDLVYRCINWVDTHFGLPPTPDPQ